MKTPDLRLLHLALTLLALTACGNTHTPETVFQEASDECAYAAVPNRFMVKYTDGHRDVIAAASKQDFINGYLSENLDRIAYAEHDFQIQTETFRQNSQEKSGEIDNWGTQRINAQILWEQNIRGDGARVAVIDSGMDLNHPQLRKRVFTNPGEQGLDEQGHDRSTNGLDDDRNGFIDDAMGYDFAYDRPLQGDNNYHGSHVSGIIAAQHDDTIAASADHVQGVAPEAKILPLAFLGEDGSGLLSDAVRAIDYAALRGVDVVNASWGGSDCSRSLAESIARLNEKGITFVVAAGNSRMNIDRYRAYPASLLLPAQITVGAIGENNYMAEYSNFGIRAVHLFAPGTLVYSTVPGGYAPLSGTSMAAPFVAGAVALLRSAIPSATPTQLREALMASATHSEVDYLNASKGRLDLSKALSDLRQKTSAQP
jgi:subtilisin family serine protease